MSYLTDFQNEQLNAITIYHRKTSNKEAILNIIKNLNDDYKLAQIQNRQELIKRNIDAVELNLYRLKDDSIKTLVRMEGGEIEEYNYTIRNR
jgi:hypothetical protein